MKLVILASLLSAAAAFAPAQQGARSSTAIKSFENEIGAVPPLGFYDPLKLCKDEAAFERLRTVELKHGRIAMLAVVGYITTAAGIRLPGDIAFGTTFESIPGGFAALKAIPEIGLAQILVFIGFLETSFMRDWVGGEHIGDFRNNFIDFGWDNFSPEEKTRQKNIEINQGRAAQMGILGIMVHEQLGNVDDLFLFLK